MKYGPINKPPIENNPIAITTSTIAPIDIQTIESNNPKVNPPLQYF